MDTDVEIQRIVESISFSKYGDRTVPRDLKLIFENIDYIQNQTISIFFAKVIRHIESKNINLNLVDHTRTSLPPSVYYGIIHPSSDIRRFCRNKLNEKHTRNSFTNLGDYTNIIHPILTLIIQNLSFMNYTNENQGFDRMEQSINVTTKSALQSFMTKRTNDAAVVQYVEAHLYSGLKLLIDKLSDDIINNRFLSVSNSDLWNILLAQINHNEPSNILSHCCNIMRRVLKCNNHYLLWEHPNLLIPNIDEFILRMCHLFMCSLKSGSKKLTVYKEVISCLDAAVQSKGYINDDKNDMRLAHQVIECLLTESWKKHDVSPQIGPYILNTAFRIIGSFLNDEDESKQQIMCSLSDDWSKICVDFAIAGNIQTASPEENQDVMERLSMYSSIGANNIVTLQSNKVTSIVTQVLMMDTKNVMNILQTYLFSTRYARQNSLQIRSYHPFTKNMKSDDALYQNNRLWIELLSSKIDPWNYPVSIHKLMFEMYRDLAPLDHLQCYAFRNKTNDMMREYLAVCKGWMTRIGRYFGQLAEDNDGLALGVIIQNGTSVIQSLISSYILSGNEAIKTKMDDMIHAVLNPPKEDSGALLNPSLKGQGLKLILRHYMMNKKDFVHFVTAHETQMEEHDTFVRSIVDGVIMAIELFENRLPILSEIPTLFSDDAEVALQYFFGVKEHIVSMIANTFNFIDYFRSNNIKWDAGTNDNNNKRKKNQTQHYLCFSEIIFSYSEALHVMIEYVLLCNDGIFGCASADFIRNQYFDDNEGRIQDLVNIMAFLTNHWTKYIEPLLAEVTKQSFDHETYVFEWFQMMKFSRMGKAWLMMMQAITQNNHVKQLFVSYMNREMNKMDITQILAEHFDLKQIEMHEGQCEDSNCSEYHMVDREMLIDLLGDLDGQAGVKSQTAKPIVENSNSSAKPLRKKLKKTKQFKITEFYSLSPSRSSTPGGSPSMQHNKLMDCDEDDSDECSNSNSGSAKPNSLIHSQYGKHQTSFTISDKQLFAADNKLMYLVDSTVGGAEDGTWKYRKEIIAEFGIIGRQIIDKYNEENKDHTVETMWGVNKILDKRVNPTTGKIEYEVLWDTDLNERTWEEEENLQTCKLSIEDFERVREQRKSRKKRKCPFTQNQSDKQPAQKKRKLKNHRTELMDDDDDDSSSSSPSLNSSCSIDDFLIGDYSEGEDDYDPKIDKKLNQQKIQCKKKFNGMKLNQQKGKKALDVTLKLSVLDRLSAKYCDDKSKNNSDARSESSDFPLSASHLMYQKKKKQKQLQKPMVNKSRKRPTNLNINHNQSDHNDASSHLNEMMGSCYDFNNNNQPSHSHGNRISPSGDIVPTSNISTSFKKTLSKSSGQSKLSKLHRDHRNSILAGNMVARISNSNQFRKRDRSKTGNFKKRNGGAVILPTSHARRNRMNQGTLPKIPKTLKIPKISKMAIPKNNNVKTKKFKQKLPAKRNKFDNTLFKTQHKKRIQHNNNRMNGNMNRNTIYGSQFRDCHLELFKKILEWSPNHVESAFNETKIDLSPMADEYDDAEQYKILSEPFLLEEVRAQTAQAIQEKKSYRLITRAAHDTRSQQRTKNQQHHNHHKQTMLYDVTKTIHYKYHPSCNLSSVHVQPLKQHTRLNKTYYNHDLVLLNQDAKLTQNASNVLKIEEVIHSSILGIVKTTDENGQMEVYINAADTRHRSIGGLCAVIYLNSMVTACREYRCLSTMSQNIWAPMIIKPKKIFPVDGMTLTRVRDEQLPKWMANKLNEEQLNAISAVLVRNNNISLIKGPPGTGKTTTIVSLMNAALLTHGWLQNTSRPKILVCAPSNAAIDTVIKRTYRNMKSQSGNTKLKVKMVRIGSGATRDTVASRIHIDKLLKSQDPNFQQELLEKELKNLRTQKEELTGKWKKARNAILMGNEDAKKREKKLADKLRANQIEKSKLETALQKQRESKPKRQRKRVSKGEFIRDQDVVFSTLSASASPFLNNTHFDLLIIDESTQASEISTLIPFQLNIGSIVLVGDEKQLPATVISNQCEIFGYSCSFFERCIKNNIEPYLLTVQYRMHPAIRSWPSIRFYDNKLRDGANIKNSVIPFVESHEKDPRLGPYAFFDIYQHEEECTTGKTYTNKAELDFILRLLDYMSHKFYAGKKSHEWDGNVGVVTPYRGQVNSFRKHLASHGNKLLQSVVVDTVESFQGQEKDIIVFSCVRSQREAATNIEKANLGFLTDLRRLNVALTRAKLCCFIVGNSNTLKSNKTWKQLIRDAHHRGCIYKVGMKDHKAWLNRPSEQFVSTLQQQTNQNKAMDVDDDDKSNSASSSSSSSKRSKSRKSHHNRRSKSHQKHNKNRKKKKRRLTDAQIARILNLPSPPTDPRLRRK